MSLHQIIRHATFKSNCSFIRRHLAWEFSIYTSCIIDVNECFAFDSAVARRRSRNRNRSRSEKFSDFSFTTDIYELSSSLWPGGSNNHSCNLRLPIPSNNATELTRSWVAANGAFTNGEENFFFFLHICTERSFSASLLLLVVPPAVCEYACLSVCVCV